MSIPNELKVGALTVVGVVTLVLGFYYLKGVEIFKSTKKVYVLLEDAANVKGANPVSLHGKQIGKVTAVNFNPDENYKVIFDLTIDRHVEVPKGSVVKIIELDLLGNKELRIVFPDTTREMIGEGDTLYGELKGNLFATVENKISPIIEMTQPLMTNMDNMIRNFNDLLIRNKEVIDASLVSFERTMSNFEAISGRMDTMMIDQSDNIESIMGNAREFSQTLSENASRIDSILIDLQGFSSELSEVELASVVDQAGASLEEMHQALETLNNAEGTLGKLIYEEDVYTELDSTLGSLNELLIDLKEHPKRYVSFSLIGRKDKKKD